MRAMATAKPRQWLGAFLLLLIPTHEVHGIRGVSLRQTQVQTKSMNEPLSKHDKVNLNLHHHASKLLSESIRELEQDHEKSNGTHTKASDKTSHDASQHDKNSNSTHTEASGNSSHYLVHKVKVLHRDKHPGKKDVKAKEERAKKEKKRHKAKEPKKSGGKDGHKDDSKEEPTASPHVSHDPTVTSSPASSSGDEAASAGSSSAKSPTKSPTKAPTTSGSSADSTLEHRTNVFYLQYNVSNPTTTDYEKLSRLTGQYLSDYLSEYYDDNVKVGFVRSDIEAYVIPSPDTVEYKSRSSFDSDRSVPTTGELDYLITHAFKEGSSEMVTYMNRLSSLGSDNAFSQASSASMISTENLEADSSTSPETTTSQSKNIDAIVGSSVAIGSAILVAVALILYRRNRQEQNLSEGGDTMHDKKDIAGFLKQYPEDETLVSLDESHLQDGGNGGPPSIINESFDHRNDEEKIADDAAYTDDALLISAQQVTKSMILSAALDDIEMANLQNLLGEMAQKSERAISNEKF